LSISAHWYFEGLAVTGMDKPRTIHDFYGFPDELFKMEYPAPGAPAFAESAKELLTDKGIEIDNKWGLDHGTWSVLCRMYPKADIPTFQLSIDSSKPPRYHYETGKRIKELRSRGVLIMGSGNIVHNLRMLKFDDTSFDWVHEFDSKVKELIDKRDFESVIDYKNQGQAALMSVPTPDHYFPLLYILGAASKDEEINYFAEGISLGSLSMRSVKIGG